MSIDKKMDLYNDLSSNDCSLRRKAIISLKEYADNETIKLIEKLFNDEDTSVRYFAKKIVKEIKDKMNAISPPAMQKEIIASSALIEEKKSITSQPQIPLPQVIELSAERLNNILNGIDSEQKTKTLESLFLNSDNSILPIIIEKIKFETNEKVISLMVKLIGKLGGENYIKIIITFLNNNDLRIKANAIEALELVGTPKTIPFIVPFLNNDDNRIKANAIKALSRFQPAEMLQILSKMIKSEKVWMRDSAIFALGQIKNDESVELLNITLYDNDINISEHTLQVLSKLELPLAQKYIKIYNDKMNKKPTNLEFDVEVVDNLFQNIDVTKVNSKESQDNKSICESQNNQPLQNGKAAEPKIKNKNIKHCPRCKAEQPISLENCECGYEFTVAKMSDIYEGVKNTAGKIIQVISSTSQEKTKICSRCQKENPVSKKSCGKCGLKFPIVEPPQPQQTNEAKNCPECGLELIANVKNCPECGFEITPNKNTADYANDIFNSAKNSAVSVASNIASYASDMFNSVKSSAASVASNSAVKTEDNVKVCPECGLEQAMFQKSCSECGFTFAETEPEK